MVQPTRKTGRVCNTRPKNQPNATPGRAHERTDSPSAPWMRLNDLRTPARHFPGAPPAVHSGHPPVRAQSQETPMHAVWSLKSRRGAIGFRQVSGRPSPFITVEPIP